MGYFRADCLQRRSATVEISFYVTGLPPIVVPCISEVFLKCPNFFGL